MADQVNIDTINILIKFIKNIVATSNRGFSKMQLVGIIDNTGFDRDKYEQTTNPYFGYELMMVAGVDDGIKYGKILLPFYRSKKQEIFLEFDFEFVSDPSVHIHKRATNYINEIENVKLCLSHIEGGLIDDKRIKPKKRDMIMRILTRIFESYIK